MKSIHVPASVVERIYRVLKWVAVSIAPVALATVVSTWQWIVGRVDGPYVAKTIAPVSLAAKAAQADSMSAKELAKRHQPELEALWRELVLVRAELYVQRSFPSQPPATRAAWVQQAREFYEAAWDADREARPNDPASKAAARVLRAAWRP